MIYFKKIKRVVFMSLNRIVAFDIECSVNVANYSEICAFGYTLADNNFEIIQKRDILIKPKKKMQRRIDDLLPFTQEQLDKSPTFNEVFEELLSILTQSNDYLFAHDAQRDLGYLILECEKNGLEPPNLLIYDTKKIFEIYTDSKKLGLSSMAEWSGIMFDAHLPSEDSSVCIAFMRKIRDEKGEDFENWLKSLKQEITLDTNAAKQKLINNKLKWKYDSIMSKKPKNYAGPNSLADKIVSISNKIEEDDLELALELAETIHHKGGVLSKGTKKSNILIAEKNDDSKRSKCAEIMLDKGLDIEIITPSLFLIKYGRRSN